MTKRGSSQFLLLFFRPSVRLGWRIGGTIALIALIAVAGAGLVPVLHQSAWQHALAGDNFAASMAVGEHVTSGPDRGAATWLERRSQRGQP